MAVLPGSWQLLAGSQVVSRSSRGVWEICQSLALGLSVSPLTSDFCGQRYGCVFQPYRYLRAKAICMSSRPLWASPDRGWHLVLLPGLPEAGKGRTSVSVSCFSKQSKCEALKCYPQLEDSYRISALEYLLKTLSFFLAKSYVNTLILPFKKLHMSPRHLTNVLDLRVLLSMWAQKYGKLIQE